ncbi:ABC transporter permease [Fulvivirgaceae bacterium PWU5]|uniref:ABC transporter permease n=1 Tax=Dawidia cretensis TaxID=2782350 RepID=A0AAP2GPG0_9BACT|nr:ABC transporter permease [Dawidia cretensis]MBT1708596.1 ABC transporter permease [Dawidia cretensis]
MLRNYLTVAFRNIVKNKVFSGINILGLGIGLAACLLIFQFVRYELSYDTFHAKIDRTYRVTNDRFQHGKLIQHGTITYPAVGPAMVRDFPEIEEYTRLMPAGTLNIRIDDQHIRSGQSHFADEHFFSVFSFSMLAGDRLTALKEPLSAVLTEHAAKQFFPAQGADYASMIGKTFYWGTDTEPYTVKAICQDIPANSHIQFDVLISYATLVHATQMEADNSWTWSDMRHYLVLKPGVDHTQLEAKFPAFSDRHFQGDKVSGSVEKFYLQPLRDAHLYSQYEYDIAKVASGKAVWAMLIVALFILLIAWINYINLTTSRALDRAKEVGLRKVMGAFKTQLIKQFIFESFILTGLAFVVAMMMAQLLQAPFNKITGNDLSLWRIIQTTDTRTLVAVAALLLLGALVSGFYPALVLSSYQPITVLKGKFQRSARGNFLRKALVIVQFTSSAALITGTIIVSQQLNFINDADLGMVIDNTVIVNAPELSAWDSSFMQRVESYKHALLQLPGVEHAATSANLPGDRLARGFNLHLKEQTSAKYTISYLGVDHHFMSTYNMSLVAGRGFLPTDHQVDYDKIRSIILNVNATRLLGISTPEDAIGKELTDDKHAWTIVGVIRDFHQESLKSPMEPTVLMPTYSTYAATSIKIKTEDTKSILASIENTYKKYFPGNAFEYFFLKDRYNRQYHDDMRFGKIVSIFTGLAIIVACLGLIGLSSYTAVQRTKEIGIRKILGASVVNIVSLLSADFVRLVLIASLLSIPIAYFSMQHWLQGYAYRVTPGWAQFVIPLLAVLLIATFTISFQVLKAAMRNPADTLKHE